jgi:hypothetical protein
MIPERVRDLNQRIREIASNEASDPERVVGPDDAEQDNYPKTYGPGDRVRAIFDPATKHYVNAFAPPEPAVESDQERERARRANREALQYVLRCVCKTRFRTQLVLRGSATLASWFGSRAREPKDLDFVVRPEALSIESEEARAIEDEIVRAVAEQPRVGELLLMPDRVERDYIWTYDRVPGRRLSIPWKTAGVPAGVARIDLVFNEPIFTEPIEDAVSITGAEPERCLVATPDESLVWKLLWLVTDSYPQGKDLFDAALLRERVAVDEALVTNVFTSALEGEDDAELPSQLDWRARLASSELVDWDNFVSEYPDRAEGLTVALLRERIIATSTL